MWLPPWLDYRTVTYSKISPKMVNTRDKAGEHRRRRGITLANSRRGLSAWTIQSGPFYVLIVLGNDDPHRSKTVVSHDLDISFASMENSFSFILYLQVHICHKILKSGFAAFCSLQRN